MYKFFFISLFAFILIAALACTRAHPQESLSNKNNSISAATSEGKKLFEATCVRCHGMDGTGLTGPSLKRPRLRHAQDMASFTTVVEQGIPGTGMPGNWAITDTECHQLYAYINYLKNLEKELPNGDTAAGKAVYLRTGCAMCHVMNGEGNSIGPELTEIGASRTAAYLLQSLVDPGATLPESTDFDNGYGFSLYLLVKIKAKDGKEITGLRINEDTYTIQIKDAANTYYSFNKVEIQSIEKQYGQSLMPSFKHQLSDKELENLVAYLYKSGNQ